jgi:outer membrane protein
MPVPFAPSASAWLPPRGLTVLALATSLAAQVVRAEDAGVPKSDNQWIVTVGGWGDLEPKFEGARRHEFGWRGLIDYRSSGSREWLNLPNDGFDFAFFETNDFRIGPVGNWRWARDVDSIPRGFRHFGSIDLSVEAGVFAEYWPSNYLRTRIEVREAFIGADGLIADLSADWVWRPTWRWTLTVGPRLSLADAAFMHSYYSVNAQQALARGLPAYSADPGARSAGAGITVKYKITEQLATMGFVEAQRLIGSAAESPLIDGRGTPNQISVGLGLSYSFAVNW